MKVVIVASIVIGIGYILSPSTPATAQPPGLSSDSYLTPEKKYSTQCMKAYDGNWPFGGGLVDGRLLYSAEQSLYFTTLDLLTGECSKASSVPSSKFDPKAISDKYLVAEDDNFGRYTAYLKGDWSRKGSLRLRDIVIASAISGDTLYLLQYISDPIGRNSNVLSTFSLPDMHYLGAKTLDLSGDSFYLALSTAHAFLLFDYGDYKVATYDFITGQIRRAEIPRNLRSLANSQSCGRNATLLGDSAVFVNTECGIYTVFDLKDLTRRYDIRLLSPHIFAKAYLIGKLLYVFEQPQPPLQAYDVQVFDFETGELVVNLPAIADVGQAMRIFPVGDRLVRADQPAYSTSQVVVYRARTRSN